MKRYVSLPLLVSFLLPIPKTFVKAQEISQLTICESGYDLFRRDDSIRICFSLSDVSGERKTGISKEELNTNLHISADNVDISPDRLTFNRFNTRKIIPSDYTFSIIIDQTLPIQVKKKIFEDIRYLTCHSVPGSVFISFLGELTSTSVQADQIVLTDFTAESQKFKQDKHLYSTILTKSIEFSPENGSFLSAKNPDFRHHINDSISSRASQDNGKNILLIFLDGDKRPDDDEPFTFLDICRFRQDFSGKASLPVLNFFYWSHDKKHPVLINTFKGLTKPFKKDGHILNSGEYLPIDYFSNTIEDYLRTEYESSYDYSVSFKTDHIHRGEETDFIFTWKEQTIGTYTCHIGLPEKPWPETFGRAKTSKYLSSFALTLLFIILVYSFHEIGTPLSGSIIFSLKYYKRYIPDAAVHKRICPYCKMPILEHQSVVVRCHHIMHLHCWKENNYRCVEYGQNCTDGIQPRIRWSGLFEIRTFKKHINIIIGIIAGFIGWISYDLTDGTLFIDISSKIIKTITSYVSQGNNGFSPEYAAYISAVITIGLINGFLSSITFRLLENNGRKAQLSISQIIFLSILTSTAGLLISSISSITVCMLLSHNGINYIPWYCSLPCHLLFAVIIALCLGVKSNTSASKRLIGGILSSVTGYLILYYSGTSNPVNYHIPILLYFLIFYWGLGISFTMKRVPPVKFSLMIQNGLRRGLLIPIHKWLNHPESVSYITIGMSSECEIRMIWEKNGEIAKRHAIISRNPEDRLPEIKALADGIIYNDSRYMNINETITISDGDKFKIGSTSFRYCEND